MTDEEFLNLIEERIDVFKSSYYNTDIRDIREQLDSLKHSISIIDSDTLDIPAIVSRINECSNKITDLENSITTLNHHYERLSALLEELQTSGSINPTTPISGDINTSTLPTSTPPSWVMNELPKPIVLHKNSSIYVGPYTGTSKYTTDSAYLLLAKSSKNSSTMYLYNKFTKDYVDNITLSTCGDTIANYYYNSFDKNLYCLFSGSKSSSTKYALKYYKKSNSGTTKKESDLVSNPIATAFSPHLKKILIINANGQLAILSNSKVSSNTAMIKSNISKTYSIGMPVNIGCAAWSPIHNVFCISGPNGTAISADGQNWNKFTTAPANLVELTYRDDLKVFMARHLESKLFYTSADGQNWVKLTNNPIPMDNIVKVVYSPEYKWYLAIGNNTREVLISSNLEDWTRTNLTNGTNISAADCKYIPNLKLFVLIPQSGSYYYTLDPSKWVS